MEASLSESVEVGVAAFLNGSTIDEVRALWGFGRNKTIKMLKRELGEEKYSEVAWKTAMNRRNIASVKVNKGRKHGPMPEERKKKIAASHVGVRHTQETKKKISESLKKRIEEVGPLRTKESLIAGAAKAKETKIRNGIYEKFSQKMTGRRFKMSEETKQKMKQAKLRFFKNGGTCWMKGRNHSEVVREKISERTRRMWEDGAFDRGNGLWRSQIEKDVFDYLSERFTCKHSHRIKNRVYDIFVEELNLMIEINGDYWHFNPELYSENHYDERRDVRAAEIWSRDRMKAELAIQSGYSFCCIWQKNLTENFQGTIENAISNFKGEDRQWETNTPN
jgi:hypothetical protein